MTGNLSSAGCIRAVRSIAMADNAWTIDARTGSTSSRVYFPHAKYIGGHGHKVCAYKRINCRSVDTLVIRALM